MKLQGIVIAETSPKSNSMIIKFVEDKKNQHFEVKCSFNPHEHRFRKWDHVVLWIKWESEIFEDEKTGEKSYFTHLMCYKAQEVKSDYD